MKLFYLALDFFKNYVRLPPQEATTTLTPQQEEATTLNILTIIINNFYYIAATFVSENDSLRSLKQYLRVSRYGLKTLNESVMSVVIVTNQIFVLNPRKGRLSCGTVT